MMPDASQWRSEGHYGHVEKLTASGLAWEWLRRNEAYNQDFEALSAQEADTTVLTEKIRQRWRLRFPGKSISDHATPSPFWLPEDDTSVVVLTSAPSVLTHAGDHPPLLRDGNEKVDETGRSCMVPLGNGEQIQTLTTGPGSSRGNHPA